MKTTRTPGIGNWKSGCHPGILATPYLILALFTEFCGKQRHHDPPGRQRQHDPFNAWRQLNRWRRRSLNPDGTPQQCLRGVPEAVAAAASWISIANAAAATAPGRVAQCRVLVARVREANLAAQRQPTPGAVQGQRNGARTGRAEAPEGAEPAAVEDMQRPERGTVANPAEAGRYPDKDRTAGAKPGSRAKTVSAGVVVVVVFVDC